MKQFIGLVALFLLIASKIYGQQPYDNKADMTSNLDNKSERIQLSAIVSRPSIKKAEKGPFYIFSLPVRLTLFNQLDTSLIAIKDEIAIVEIRLSQTKEGHDTNNFWYDVMGLPSFKNDSLKKLEPTLNAVYKINPGAEIEWEMTGEVLILEKDEHQYSRPYLSLENLKNHETLWITLYVSFFPMNTMEVEGNELKKRWQNDGRLLIETLRTKPIKVCIPALSPKPA